MLRTCVRVTSYQGTINCVLEMWNTSVHRHAGSCGQPNSVLWVSQHMWKNLKGSCLQAFPSCIWHVMHPLNIGIWKTTFLPDFDTKIRNVVVDDAQRMPHRRAVWLSIYCRMVTGEYMPVFGIYPSGAPIGPHRAKHSPWPWTIFLLSRRNNLPLHRLPTKLALLQTFLKMLLEKKW